MTAVLIEDVFSVFKDGKDNIQYGQAGQKVRIVADHGNVVIVETTGGMRFPARKSDLNIK